MRIPAVGFLRFLDHCQGENIGTSQSPRMRWLMIVRQCVERIDASLARYDQPNLYVSSNPLLPIGTANKTVLGIIVRWPASLYIVEYINMYYLQRIENILRKNSWRIRNCWKGKILGKTAMLNIHSRNTEVQNHDLMIHFTRERTPSCRESYFCLGTSYLLTDNKIWQAEQCFWIASLPKPWITIAPALSRRGSLLTFFARSLGK